MEKLIISIIIATRNRNQLLNKTLLSLTTQSFNKYFEVIVCDDGGNTNTDQLVKKYSNKLNINYFHCKDLGEYCWAQAKNLGAKKAKANYLLFMDDDILIPANGIEKMYKWITRFPWRKNKYFATPLHRLYVYNNFSDELITADYNKIQEHHINNYKNDVTLGCMGIIHKNIFNKIGGFDEILFRGLQLGDTDITKRLEGFLGVTNKKLSLQVYHLDNDPYRDNRNVIAIKRKNIAKQLIKEKLHLMNFKFNNLGDTLQKDQSKNDEGFYENLLKNKEELDKISIAIRKKLTQYDKPSNYFKPYIRK